VAEVSAVTRRENPGYAIGRHGPDASYPTPEIHYQRNDFDPDSHYDGLLWTAAAGRPKTNVLTGGERFLLLGTARPQI
jgi:hypothetical protein